MKTTIFIVTLLLCILGCNSKQNDTLTRQEKDQIKKDVSAVVDSLFSKFEKLDWQGAIQLYSPELVNVFDTSVVYYEAYKERWSGISNAVSIKTTPIRENYIVLSKDFVISDWVGKLEILWKSGDKFIWNPISYTNVLKKVDGQWKAIYEHPYGTPVIQAAEKK
jgi:hypothetical protein